MAADWVHVTDPLEGDYDTPATPRSVDTASECGIDHDMLMKRLCALYVERTTGLGADWLWNRVAQALVRFDDLLCALKF